MNTINNAAYEGDIVSRMRNWRGLHLAHGGTLFEEAADEIERLRERGNRQSPLDSLPSPTDEEREAIEWCLSLPMLDRDAVRMMPLRSLLARLA